MSQQDNILSVRLIKKNGKLDHANSGQHAIYLEFVKALEEGQVVEMFFSAHKDDGTNLQLAKVHVCIRKLAEDTGYTMDEMKKEIKRMAGLCWYNKENRGEVCKSFADCSKEELGLAIQAIFEVGDTVGVNFRGHLPEVFQDQSPQS